MMGQLETGNIGIGNNSTLVTLHNDRVLIIDDKEFIFRRRKAAVFWYNKHVSVRRVLRGTADDERKEASQ